MRFTRRGRIALAGTNAADEQDRGLFLYVPAGEGAVAIRLMEDEMMPWMSNHNGPTLDGSMVLDYVCEEDGFCDEVPSSRL